MWYFCHIATASLYIPFTFSRPSRTSSTCYSPSSSTVATLTPSPPDRHGYLSYRSWSKCLTASSLFENVWPNTLITTTSTTKCAKSRVCCAGPSMLMWSYSESSCHYSVVVCIKNSGAPQGNVPFCSRVPDSRHEDVITPIRWALTRAAGNQ